MHPSRQAKLADKGSSEESPRRPRRQCLFYRIFLPIFATRDAEPGWRSRSFASKLAGDFEGEREENGVVADL